MSIYLSIVTFSRVVRATSNHCLIEIQRKGMIGIMKSLFGIIFLLQNNETNI